MKNMKYLSASLFLLSFLWLTVSSCKKGCTNPHAVNYNASAKEEDASCLFCDSILVDSTSGIERYVDELSSSVYYQRNVLDSKESLTLYKYSGNDCQKLGIKSACDSNITIHNFGYVEVTLINKIQDTIILNGLFKILIGAASLPYPQINITDLNIPPYSSVIIASNYYLGCIQTNVAGINQNGLDYSFQYK